MCRWSLIAGRIPGHTDNEIKNYWNSRLRRKLHAAPDDQVEATPISCSHLDSALELQGSPSTSTAPSTSFVSEANQAVASPGECSFPEYAEDFAASSDSLIIEISSLPEYARFQLSGEATPSEPCSSARSSDATACLDYCSDHQYDSTWTSVASDFSADSMKHESYAYSPESVFSQALDSEEDFLCSSDFMSFSNGLADLGDTSFQMLLNSPMHTNLVTTSWPVDAFWS